jgi:hypothetical protein
MARYLLGGEVTLARWLVALALFALAIAACTRVVVLTGPDASIHPDGHLPDALIDDGGHGLDGLDSSIPPDANTLD